MVIKKESWGFSLWKNRAQFGAVTCADCRILLMREFTVKEIRYLRKGGAILV